MVAKEQTIGILSKKAYRFNCNNFMIFAALKRRCKIVFKGDPEHCI